MNKKFIFNHNLGDNIQFGIVLKHIEKYRPEWNITLDIRQPYRCLFNPIYFIERQYDEVKNLLWFPYVWHDGLPATKATKLILDLKIKPDLTLYKYSIEPFPLLPKFQDSYILLHGRGISASRRKNLTDSEINYFLNIPNSILLDQENVLGHLTENRLTSLSIPELCSVVAQADKVIGIDSGVTHLATALCKEVHVIWKRFIPYHNYEPHDNTTHWLGPEALTYGFWKAGTVGNLDWMEENYKCNYINSIEEIKI